MPKTIYYMVFANADPLSVVSENRPFSIFQILGGKTYYCVLDMNSVNEEYELS
jgi:hypothetical protein